MNIANNILKHHLSHVYWVFGTACAGKSSTTKYLSEKYDMVLYDSDNKYHDYKKLSNKESQPAMNFEFANWEEYFNRPPKVYAQWLVDSLLEQLDIMIGDLLTFTKEKKIIVDTHCFIDDPVKISSYNQIIYLTSDVELAIKQNLQRDDKRDLFECINALKNPDEVFKNLNDTIRIINTKEHNKILESGMKYIIRDEHTKVNEMAHQMAVHFGLR